MMKNKVEYIENDIRKEITYNGHIKQIKYYKRNSEELYNGNKPSVVIFVDNELYMLTWNNTDVERIAPNRIVYHDNGNVREFSWFETLYNADEYHREDGPAKIKFDKDGKINFYGYIKHGKYHRIYGPAVYTQRLKYSWYYNDNDVTLEANQWLRKNEFDKWQDMSKDDFNRMWFEIL